MSAGFCGTQEDLDELKAIYASRKELRKRAVKALKKCGYPAMDDGAPAVLGLEDDVECLHVIIVLAGIIQAHNAQESD